MLKLRPYQQDIKTRVREAYRTYNAPCVILPCRAGKSCIAASIAHDATHKGNRVLFLVHRRELCEQITETFIAWDVDMELCDVLMVQTAARRLDKLPEYDFIITDENHHAPCNTYKKIYERYPNAKRLGLTATPWRLNGQGLIDTNDTLIEGVSVQWLLDNRYLSPYEYYAPAAFVDAERLRVRNGDFDTDSVMEQLNKPKIYGEVVSKYRQYADGKKAIAFCASIQHSKSVCAAFNAAGIAAEHIDGTTPKDERKRIMDDFRSGAIKILCNYEIVSEGVDVPDCECCLLLRPTQSLTLYVQSSMRCLNYVEGKTAIILDMVGNFERHGLPNTPREWTLNGREKRTRNAAPTIQARQCANCFKVYKGTSRVCPYCGHDNGKTRAEIKADEEAELERITELKRKQEKAELKDAGQSLEALKAYGRKKGYKPGWAYQRWQILQKYRNRY